MHISKTAKNKKKHPVLKVLLCLLLIFLIVVIGIAIWQRDNIKAYMDSRKYSQEELADKITDSKAQMQQTLDQYDLPVVRDFTFEEEEMIRKGELSVDDALQLIMRNDDTADDSSAGNDTAQPETPADEQGDTQPEAPAAADDASAVLSKYIVEVYSLKAYYLGELGTVYDEIHTKYVEGGRDKTKIPGIVANYLPQIGALESECDGKISDIISELKRELNGIGADTSICDEIYDAYINEKALRKAYYMSMY